MMQSDRSSFLLNVVPCYNVIYESDEDELPYKSSQELKEIQPSTFTNIVGQIIKKSVKDSFLNFQRVHPTATPPLFCLSYPFSQIEVLKRLSSTRQPPDKKSISCVSSIT